jgi:hypothetical protein
LENAVTQQLGGAAHINSGIVSDSIGFLASIFGRFSEQIGRLRHGWRETPSHRNLVFTSAGDRSDFDRNWVGPGQEFDLFVVYYGDDDERFERYRRKARWIIRRKGSKYQNFRHFYHANPEIIGRYRRFFILDDDLVFNGGHAAINRMFAVARRYGLAISGPSFTPDGKVSHDINAHRPGVARAYTNFVEVNAQLFSRSALDRLMYWLTPELVGWGIDFLATWANGLERRDAYAVVHEVRCRNPHDHDRDHRRELDLIPEVDQREAIWEAYARSIGCPVEFERIEYAAVADRRVTQPVLS